MFRNRCHVEDLAHPLGRSYTPTHSWLNLIINNYEVTPPPPWGLGRPNRHGPPPPPPPWGPGRGDELGNSDIKWIINGDCFGHQPGPYKRSCRNSAAILQSLSSRVYFVILPTRRLWYYTQLPPNVSKPKLRCHEVQSQNGVLPQGGVKTIRDFGKFKNPTVWNRARQRAN